MSYLTDRPAYPDLPFTDLDFPTTGGVDDIALQTLLPQHEDALDRLNAATAKASDAQDAVTREADNYDLVVGKQYDLRRAMEEAIWKREAASEGYSLEPDDITYIALKDALAAEHEARMAFQAVEDASDELDRQLAEVEAAADDAWNEQEAVEREVNRLERQALRLMVREWLDVQRGWMEYDLAYNDAIAAQARDDARDLTLGILDAVKEPVVLERDADGEPVLTGIPLNPLTQQPVAVAAGEPLAADEGSMDDTERDPWAYDPYSYD